MKFLIGNKNEFVEFVNSISSAVKVGVLTHNDLDGITSAIFMEKILESKDVKVELLDFLSWKNGMFKDAIENVKERGINKLFLLDLNVDSSEIEFFEKVMGEMDVFMIDHHPINPEMRLKNNILKTESNDCAGLILYELAKDFVDLSKWEWLICATIIAEHSFDNPENLKFVQSIYSDVKREGIFKSVPGKIASRIAFSLIYFDDDTKKVYDFVKEKNLDGLNEAYRIVEKEIDKYVDEFKDEAEFISDKNLYFYEFNPKFKISSIVTSKLSDTEHDKIFISFSKYDGFIKVSARNQGGIKDVGELMKKAVEGLEDANGGGHAKAAAATIRKEDLEEFRENLLSQ